MSEIHALSGAYAVDALEELERERFERHLADCADCRAEVESLREAASTLTGSISTAPPAHLRASVLSMISTVRPLPPAVTAEPETRRLHRLPRLLAAAAAVAAMFGAGLMVTQPWEDESSQVDLTAAERVVQATDARSLTVQVDGAEATLFVSDSLGQAALVTEDLPAAPAGEVYQLWFQKGSDMISAGLMAEADEPFLLEGDTDGAVAAGITVEPAGGSKKPSLPAVALFPFDEAT